MTDTHAYHIDGPVPETPENDPNSDDWRETRVVGTRQPKVDAYERVSGTAIYPQDVAMPEMLHGAILRCPHAHARVLSIDTTEAEKMPGVQVVITGKTPGADIPWYERGGQFYGSLFDDHCRHEGEEVAAVAAETPFQAVDAIRAIKVEYEVLPFVVDDDKALLPDAPAVQEGGNMAGEPRIRERGDIAVGFAEADVIVESTYRTACQIHAPLEPHGSVAKWDGNRLTVWDSTQGVFGVQETMAKVFGLPISNVRVIGHYMGGGFGAKLETGKYTVMAAIMARMTARPVKLFLPREDCFTVTGNRPGNTMTVKIGAKIGRHPDRHRIPLPRHRRRLPLRRRDRHPARLSLQGRQCSRGGHLGLHQRRQGATHAGAGHPAGRMVPRAGHGRTRREARQWTPSSSG